MDNYKLMFYFGYIPAVLALIICIFNPYNKIEMADIVIIFCMSLGLYLVMKEEYEKEKIK